MTASLLMALLWLIPNSERANALENDSKGNDPPLELAVKVMRDDLVIEGTTFDGTMSLEADAEIEEFTSVTIGQRQIRAKVPKYQGERMLPQSVQVRVVQGGNVVGTARLDYPEVKYQPRLLGTAAGFAHTGDMFGGYSFFGLPLHRAGLQNPMPTLDAAGESLGFFTLLAARTEIVVGLAGVENIRGPGIAYGLAIRPPLLDNSPDFLGLRLFVGYRVRPHVSGRFIFGIAGVKLPFVQS